MVSLVITRWLSHPLEVVSHTYQLYVLVEGSHVSAWCRGRMATIQESEDCVSRCLARNVIFDGLPQYQGRRTVEIFSLSLSLSLSVSVPLSLSLSFSLSLPVSLPLSQTSHVCATASHPTNLDLPTNHEQHRTLTRSYYTCMWWLRGKKHT